MIGIEIVRDQRTRKKPRSAQRDRRSGVSQGPAGARCRREHHSPVTPLLIDQEQADFAVATLEDCFREAKRMPDSRRENRKLENSSGNFRVPWLLQKKYGSHGIFVYTARKAWGTGSGIMPIFFTTDVSGGALGGAACAKRRVFPVVRKGTKPGAPAFAERLMPTGICGGRGTYLSARNYTPRGIKGELDLVGYDGKTLAFVEVRTRTIREDLPALPEL